MKKYPPTVYRAVFRDGEPVKVRPELEEVKPHHADMLRYDNAFHAPDDTSLVVFPLFKHTKDGSYPDSITGARWRSFGINLEVIVNVLDDPRTARFDDWITYHHPEINGQTVYHVLEPITLVHWLKAHPKVVVHGWRTL